MQLAKIENGNIVEVNHYRQMYPNVSFPATGPTDEFLVENDLKKVRSDLPYNHDTQVLVPAEPYILNDTVYNVVIQDIPEGELYAIAQSKQAELVRYFTESAQAHLDNFAKTRGYDSILSASSYVTSSIPRYATEAARAVSLRDQWWFALDGILKDVLNQVRAVPTSFDEIVPELPALTWE